MSRLLQKILLVIVLLLLGWTFSSLLLFQVMESLNGCLPVNLHHITTTINTTITTILINGDSQWSFHLLTILSFLSPRCLQRDGRKQNKSYFKLNSCINMQHW